MLTEMERPAVDVCADDARNARMLYFFEGLTQGLDSNELHEFVERSLEERFLALRGDARS